MANFALLDKDKHQSLRLIASTDFAHASEHHMTQVTVHEVARLCATYPVVFVKDRETGQFHLMAMLGLRPGENAFYSSEGWKASVVPQQIENYPFSLTRHPQDQAKHMVAVDLDSARVSDSEGEPLFTDSGEQTGVLQDKVTRLSRMMEEAKVTADFVKTLADMALLAPQSLSLTWPDGESRNLTGLYAIDEQKLNSLDTASFESLRQKHFVGAIYACILSMGRIDNLIERSAGR